MKKKISTLLVIVVLIVAICAVASSAAVSWWPISEAPNAPSGVKASLCRNFITVSWSDSSDCDGVVLYLYGTDKNGSERMTTCYIPYVNGESVGSYRMQKPAEYRKVDYAIVVAYEEFVRKGETNGRVDILMSAPSRPAIVR